MMYYKIVLWLVILHVQLEEMEIISAVDISIVNDVVEYIKENV